MTQRTRPSFSHYLRYLYGETNGEFDLMLKMTRRSLTMPTFAGFWRYWNPIFSYNLFYRVYRPSVRFIPRWLALILTFAISGAIHDIAASIITLARDDDIYFLFTPVFAMWGVFAVVEEALGIQYAAAPSWLRVLINLAHIVGMYFGVRFIWFNIIGFGG